jgi:hypothetical protein
MKPSSILLLFSVAFAAASPLQEREQQSNGEIAGVAMFSKAPIAQGGQGDAAAPVAKNSTNTARDLQARNNYDWIQWTNQWTFNNGVPVGGDHVITIWSSGYAEFKSHFHDSGFWSYDVSLNCALSDTVGRAYTFSRSGRMYGTIESGSRDFDLDQTTYNADIQANWVDIENGNLQMWCNAHAGSTFSWDTIVSFLNDVVKAAGAIKAVIAIF